MNDKLINPILGILIGAGRHYILKVYLGALHVFGALIFTASSIEEDEERNNNHAFVLVSWGLVLLGVYWVISLYELWWSKSNDEK